MRKPSATTRSTNRTSARTVKTVDAGFASSAEMLPALFADDIHDLDDIADDLLYATRFAFGGPGFCLAAACAARPIRPRGGCAIDPAAVAAGCDPRSVPARTARRRLHAGPTPAALPIQSPFELGLPHHH